jgi:hypothetical protein
MECLIRRRPLKSFLQPTLVLQQESFGRECPRRKNYVERKYVAVVRRDEQAIVALACAGGGLFAGGWYPVGNRVPVRHVVLIRQPRQMIASPCWALESRRWVWVTLSRLRTRFAESVDHSLVAMSPAFLKSLHEAQCDLAWLIAEKAADIAPELWEAIDRDLQKFCASPQPVTLAEVNARMRQLTKLSQNWSSRVDQTNQQAPPPR